MADDDGIALTCISHTEHGPSDEQIMQLVSNPPVAQKAEQPDFKPEGSGSIPDGGSVEDWDCGCPEGAEEKCVSVTCPRRSD